ncbi:MAG: hypothetical protein FJ044_03885 [Candidatus Cloacimonetes bacterium]|nr:hypothetical protein [Candidatus Cloacimonadota bacterium]
MNDIQSFLQYYLTLQVLGLSVWPLVKRLFPNFPDRGWAFTKILGILLVSWVVWLLGSLRIAPFTRTTIIAVVIVIAILNWFVLKFLSSSVLQLEGEEGKAGRKGAIKVIFFEEILFLASFAFWSYIRGFSPDIRGLEKFMDYGFVLSILRGKYFPPLDHFLSGSTINYYYFGHLIAALLTRLSGVVPNISFNLQIANLFALTMLGGFSIGTALWTNTLVAAGKTFKVSADLTLKVKEEAASRFSPAALLRLIIPGLLTALFVAVIGNLHTIINIFREGQSYWYPTATRLIPYTIHEFPIYSFVVADLHGHVSDLPIVLLTVALLISYVFYFKTEKQRNRETEKQKLSFLSSLVLQFLSLAPLALTIGAMFATNTWDFLIYWLLTGLVFLYLNWRTETPWLKIFLAIAKTLIPVFVLSILFFLPYHLTVKPIAKGIDIVHDWSPPFLWFQMWGFHLLLALSFLAWTFRKKIKSWLKPESIVKAVASALGVKFKVQNSKFKVEEIKRSISDNVALIFIGLSAFLIALPEIIYFKDIYPAHYRANTMFKFFYQAWVILGIACSYGVLRIIKWLKKNQDVPFRFLFLGLSVFLFFSVLLYPYIALRQSTNQFKDHKNLDGTRFLEIYFPSDAKAIDWLNGNVSGQPTIVEAVGESYTDYARVCSNTGIPAVLGWPVHEWLWRGSYDEAGRRTADIQTLYETDSVATARELLRKYQVDYVYVGGMEKEKYKELKVGKFEELGEVVYENEEVRIYKVKFK